MSFRPSKGWIWLLLPLSAIAFFVGAVLFFYRGSYSPPAAVSIPVEQITLPSQTVKGPADTPVIRQGVLVLDNVHRNHFDVDELNTLISRVADRGYTVSFVAKRGNEFPLFPTTRLERLDELLRRADSFGVILPRNAYDPEELELVRRFVSKGGKLLLIGDPARPSAINSVADAFGILFQEGYLYNVVENDLNFRNIFVRDFRPDQVTQGLSAITLHTGGAIKSRGTPLAFTDTNTRSSMVERVEPFAPLVKGADGAVLAVHDLTFMMPPQNSTLDNDKLVSNIADFLTTSERRFDLGDFPHFFDSDVEILLGNAGIFDIGARLKAVLSGDQIASEVRGVEDLTQDTVFLGLYQDSLAVAQYLSIAGVRVEESLRTPFTPDIAIENTAVLSLHQGDGRRVLIVLGDSPQALQTMVERLASGNFRAGLVSDFLGVYRVP